MMRLRITLLQKVIAIVLIVVGLCALLDSILPTRVWRSPEIQGIVKSEGKVFSIAASGSGWVSDRVRADLQGNFRVPAMQVAWLRIWNILGGDSIEVSRIDFFEGSELVGTFEIGLGGAEQVDSEAAELWLRAEQSKLPGDKLDIAYMFLPAKNIRIMVLDDYAQCKRKFFLTGNVDCTLGKLD